MAYQRSLPLEAWLGVRRRNIDTLAEAHAAIGVVVGAGRPLEVGRPVGHAYVLRVVSEFQAFVRDMHDLTVERMVDLAGTEQRFQPFLIFASTAGRQIDRANADLRTMDQDFRRLGIGSLDARMQALNSHWNPSGRRGDRAFYADLIELRNALAHGNQRQLQRLRDRGVMDTITWARRRLAGLDRTAKAVDRVVWDHVVSNFGAEPW